jgi:ubiquinone/menaquinone biosynthesis C-methylase UbiE
MVLRAVGSISSSTLPVLASRDRRCRGWTLDNWVRRWWAPASIDVDLLSVQPGHRVADLGAGVGYLTRTLLDRVGSEGTVDFVEPDPRNFARARIRWAADRRVKPLQASATQIPSIPDRSVDRVVMSLVLCCMVDKAGALNEGWRILRPGGLALISYPERRRRRKSAKGSLRMTPDLWGGLVAQRPWTLLSSQRRWIVRRHVLQKPAAPA